MIGDKDYFKFWKIFIFAEKTVKSKKRKLKANDEEETQATEGTLRLNGENTF